MKDDKKYFLFLIAFVLITMSCKSAQIDDNTSIVEKSETTQSSNKSDYSGLIKERKIAVKDNQELTTQNGCFSLQVYSNNQKDCGKTDQPVCGCNKMTYQNECEAKKAGLTSWKKGKCSGEAADN